jgi:DNA-binding CsgD family transcriptional regulator/tetratricopeptide (TPR) repeat protein
LQQAFDIYRAEGLEVEAIRVLERIVIVQSRNYDTEGGVRIAERALDSLDRGASSQAVFGLLITTAGLELSLGNVQHAKQLLDRAEACATVPGGIIGSGFHDVRARLHASRGQYPAALADFEASIRIARDIDGGDALIRVLTNAADLYALLGRTSEAVDLWAESFTLARARHLSWRIPFTAFGCAGVLIGLGDLQRALEYVEAAMRYDFESRAVRVRAAEVGIPLGMLLEREDIVERCDDSEILERVFASRDASRLASLAAAYVPLLMQRGATADAKALIGRAAGVLRSGDESPALYLHLARYASLGDLTDARKALENAARRSSDHVANAFLPMFDAITNRRQRRFRAAKEQAALAERRFGTLGLRYWQAVALELGDQERKATTLFRTIGAGWEVKRLEKVLTKSSPISQMTPRENEVAELVRAGMTNRQISDRLRISEHTVESHLKSIFNRLGIRSRWQISAAGDAEAG